MSKTYNFFFVFLLTKTFLFGQSYEFQEIAIRPVFQGKFLQLDKSYFSESLNDSLKITRFCVYISNLELKYEDGSIFQDSNFFHLLDTDNSATLFFNAKKNDAKKIKSVRFYLGVDSLACVSGALEGALDPANGMYWAWNSGYINAKLEGSCLSIPSGDKHFEFHIGGYLSPNASIRMVEIAVNQSHPLEKLILDAELSVWFKDLNMKQNYRIVMPGAEAMKMADRYSLMFR